MRRGGLYSSMWVHRIQTLWILTIMFAAIGFVKICSWSLWITIPLALVGFAAVSWIGITIIAMFDYNHRMAGQYGIKIENLPLYFELFDRLKDMESRGIESSGIPAEVKDVNDWLRFCCWQRDESIKDLNKQF